MDTSNSSSAGSITTEFIFQLKTRMIILFNEIGEGADRALKQLQMHEDDSIEVYQEQF